MSIKTDLRARLLQDAGVTALVSDRVHFSVKPEKQTTPYIRISLITGTKISTLPGTSDPKRQILQISCFATTYSGANQLAEAVEAALDGYGYLIFETDHYEDDTKLYAVFLDWSLIA